MSSNLLEHLPHNSMPFFPLALGFRAFLQEDAQKSKFGDLVRLWTFRFFYVFFSPFLFSFSYLFVAVIGPSTGFASS